MGEKSKGEKLCEDYIGIYTVNKTNMKICMPPYTVIIKNRFCPSIGFSHGLV